MSFAEPPNLDAGNVSVGIVGAGFGGLSAACYLAAAGADVTVFEKNDQLGGRASTLEREGFRFDMGPSWYLMPDVFERFFADFGTSTSDFYELTRLDPQYRIFWKDGDRLDISPHLELNKRRFERYENGAGSALESYLEESKRQYEVGMEHFVYEDRSNLRDFLDIDVLKHARGIRLLGSMQDYVEQYFDHPKLQQVMQYSLVFLGGAPGKTPALYSLMSHVDFNLGVYYPEGGIGSVVDGIATLGRRLGVDFETNRPVTAIERNGTSFTLNTNAGTITRDRVVSNADYAHTELDLLSADVRQYGRSYWDSRTFAPSALLCYLGIEGTVDPLAHHTMVLPTDWSSHFESIFERGEWPTDPAYYVCVPSRTDERIAPPGHTAMFVLVPIAPGLEADSHQPQTLRDDILADLATHTGVDVRDRIVLEEQFCVQDFAERYNSHQGSALGLAHTLRQTALFRPNRVSTACEGLYYTGSYTNPGIGVPMCLISGRHTAKAVCEDRPAI